MQNAKCFCIIPGTSGTQLHYNRLTIIVAVTPEKTTMPNLKNISLREAIGRLDSNGLDVDYLDYVSYKYKNNVIDLPAGSDGGGDPGWCDDDRVQVLRFLQKPCPCDDPGQRDGDPDHLCRLRGIAGDQRVAGQLCGAVLQGKPAEL